MASKTEQPELDDAVKAAREKLKARFGDKVRTGGKGTERRKKKTVHKTATTDDTTLLKMMKRYNMHQFPEIEEVNMFKDDNTVMHFDKPNVNVSIRESVAVVIGTPQSKKIEELLPDIIHQVGSEHYTYLKAFAEKQKQQEKKEGAQEDDDDDMPELVETFEATSKRE